MESYDKIKKVLALGFMNFLDENKPKNKMCLSNGECADIEKAFNEQDWPRLAGYLDKYTESEDERIRKSIVATIEQCPDDFLNPKNRDRMLAYLEKQKEQKPNYCHHEVDETGWTEKYRKAYYDGWNNCNMQHEQLKADQKPAEWSEEDENKIESIKGLITMGRFADTNTIRTIWELLDSIRPSWKPSKEQMEALAWYSGNCNIPPTGDKAIKSLYNDLKKL